MYYSNEINNKFYRTAKQREGLCIRGTEHLFCVEACHGNTSVTIAENLTERVADLLVRALEEERVSVQTWNAGTRDIFDEHFNA